MGLQPWDGGGMVFSPYADFFEFIPVDVSRNTSAADQPETVLLDEVKPGRIYEVVITNFYGVPLVRYRSGHLIDSCRRMKRTVPVCGGSSSSAEVTSASMLRVSHASTKRRCGKRCRRLACHLATGPCGANGDPETLC